MRTTVLLVLLVVGCGDDWQAGDPTPKPRQDEAVDIVWRQVYGLAGSPPAIRWTDDYVEGRYCGGKTYADEGGIIVQWAGSFSESVFAHELCHARQRVVTGDVDHDHRSACFRDAAGTFDTWGGVPGTLSWVANDALVAQGL